MLPQALVAVKKIECHSNNLNAKGQTIQSLTVTEQDRSTRLDGNTSTSLERGLAILSTFGRRHQPLGITEVAGMVKMRPSTVHRYVRTLTRLGYLQQDAATKKYRLDFKVVDLGLAVINSLDVRDLARPYLQELCRKTELTVNMAVLDGPDIVYVERMLGRASIDLNLHVGSRQPAYCTSMGKVLLAGLEAKRLDEVLSQTDFIHRGRNTITTAEQLRAEILNVQGVGFAVNDEELAPGLRSISAPIYDASGAVLAAINMNGGTHSLSELKALFSPELLATAGKISRQIGGRRR